MNWEKINWAIVIGLILTGLALRFRVVVSKVIVREFFCSHKRVRCIHGDEIHQTTRAFRRPSIARTRCLDCGRALYKVELPDICYSTGKPHQVERKWG